MGKQNTNQRKFPQRKRDDRKIDSDNIKLGSTETISVKAADADASSTPSVLTHATAEESAQKQIEIPQHSERHREEAQENLAVLNSTRTAATHERPQLPPQTEDSTQTLEMAGTSKENTTPVPHEFNIKNTFTCFDNILNCLNYTEHIEHTPDWYGTTKISEDQTNWCTYHFSPLINPLLNS
jgi:hypothetical protein